MKIELRKFKMSDFERLMEIFSDKEITDALGMTIAEKPTKITKKGELVWLKKTIADYKKKKPAGFHLAVIADGVYVGNMGCFNIDYANDSAEIGYWIGKDYWGKGIATEALNLFLKEINKKFNFKRLEGGAYTFNPASKRVQEKCGFKLEGIKRCVKKGKNKYYDLYLLSKIM